MKNKYWIIVFALCFFLCGCNKSPEESSPLTLTQISIPTGDWMLENGNVTVVAFTATKKLGSAVLTPDMREGEANFEIPLHTEFRLIVSHYLAKSESGRVSYFDCPPLSAAPARLKVYSEGMRLRIMVQEQHIIPPYASLLFRNGEEGWNYSLATNPFLLPYVELASDNPLAKQSLAIGVRHPQGPEYYLILGSPGAIRLEKDGKVRLYCRSQIRPSAQGYRIRLAVLTGLNEKSTPVFTVSRFETTETEIKNIQLTGDPQPYLAVNSNPCDLKDAGDNLTGGLIEDYVLHDVEDRDQKYDREPVQIIFARSDNPKLKNCKVVLTASNGQFTDEADFPENGSMWKSHAGRPSPGPLLPGYSIKVTLADGTVLTYRTTRTSRDAILHIQVRLDSLYIIGSEVQLDPIERSKIKK
jgi:hypothetical protein